MINGKMQNVVVNNNNAKIKTRNNEVQKLKNIRAENNENNLYNIFSNNNINGSVNGSVNRSANRSANRSINNNNSIVYVGGAGNNNTQNNDDFITWFMASVQAVIFIYNTITQLITAIEYIYEMISRFVPNPLDLLFEVHNLIERKFNEIKNKNDLLQYIGVGSFSYVFLINKNHVEYDTLINNLIKKKTSYGRVEFNTETELALKVLHLCEI